jgi:hypothetical protein
MTRIALQYMAAGVFTVPYMQIMDRVYDVPWWASAGLGVLAIAGYVAADRVHKWGRDD